MSNHDPNAAGPGAPSDPDPSGFDADDPLMEELIELAELSDSQREQRAALEAREPLDGDAEKRVFDRLRSKLDLPEESSNAVSSESSLARVPVFRLALAAAALVAVGLGIGLWQGSDGPVVDPNLKLGPGAKDFQIELNESQGRHPEAIDWSSGPPETLFYRVVVLDADRPGAQPVDESGDLPNGPWLPTAERIADWPDRVLLRVDAYGSGSEQLLLSTPIQLSTRTG